MKNNKLQRAENKAMGLHRFKKLSILKAEARQLVEKRKSATMPYTEKVLREIYRFIEVLPLRIPKTNGEFGHIGELEVWVNE